MYQAIKNNKLEEIKSLLDNEADVNAPLWTTGEFAGYTALHVACIKNKDKWVELLISDYKANVNAIGDDGTLPIHLACFYETYVFIMGYYTQSDKLRCLLKAGANVHIELGREIFEKHVINKEWCPDFEKMTPLTYTIVYKKPELALTLMAYDINLKIKSLKNKTLLMYSIENDLHDVSSKLISAIEDSAYINHRDNDGIPTIHYVLYPKKYNQFRYESRELRFLPNNKRLIMMDLIEAGADKNTLINDDPATFLPNVAAYRSCSDLLQGLLTCYESMPHSKVLYNAMLPIEDSLNKMVRLNRKDRPEEYPALMKSVQDIRRETIKVALKDLVIRRTFGLHTNKEEIKLMESLITTDKEIKNIVDNFEKKFINGELKNKFINVNDKKICVLDFLKLVFDEKKLKLWAGDETTCKWDCTVDENLDFMYEYTWLYDLSYHRLENGCERFKLFEKLDKISTLRKFIDLPYEIVLEFIEYLNNNDFNAFVNAFIC